MDLGKKAKQTLMKFVGEIDGRLEAYWKEVLKNNCGHSARQKKLINEIVRHLQEHNLRPGKRFRGSLVYYGYKLGGGEINEGIWKVAMAMELVQTGLLMQDDFMDESEERRGKITTHKYFSQRGGVKYGDSMAVTVGDVVWNLGYGLMMSSRLEKSRVLKAGRILADGLVETAWGQAMDLTMGIGGKWTEEDVIALHKSKTATYSCKIPLLIGGCLGGLNDKVLDLLGELAMDMGVAFQLRDDVLGVFGDPKETGKSANSDLLQGKCTLLVLKALQRPEVRKVWGNKNASEAEIEAAKQAIRDSGSLEYSLNLMRKLAGKAASSATKLRELKLDSEAIDYLQGIAEYMVEREV